MKNTSEHLNFEYKPMEAELVEHLPDGQNWQYEPKWDGFRCLAFKTDGEVELRSKSGQTLTRYFPEVVAALEALKARNFVLDGELVVEDYSQFSFDDLLQRIHPAQSRVKKLSAERPAVYVVFDILKGSDNRELINEPLDVRREQLEEFAAKFFKQQFRVLLSPTAVDKETASGWLEGYDALIDGVIAKRTDLPYQSGNREGMQKMKPTRSVDCVIGGFRYGSKSRHVGSLLLGLYDKKGEFRHIGFTSSLSDKEKKELTEKLEKLATEKSFTENVPGGPSRWSSERSAEWTPIKPKLVVEVRYDKITNGRFRHGAKLLRWRPDKDPKQCTVQQIA
ncbi:MAG TPA: ATP-dependent DNA ligase [Chroococcales cyanobacterium]